MANRMDGQRESSRGTTSRSRSSVGGSSRSRGNGRRDRSSGSNPSGFAAHLSQGRLGTILLIFCALALIIIGRLVWLQLIDAQSNLSRGGSERSVTVDIEPRRGTIYDRNGVVLATTVDAVNVYCHPHVVSDSQVATLADTLAQVFGGEAGDYRSKIEQDTNFVYLRKSADTDAADKIKALNIEGVGFENTSKRVYPCGSTASQIIGVLNSDGEALTGLELQYDDILGGEAGQKTTEYSKEGVPVPGTTSVSAEVVNGKDIVLSVDVEMQQHLESTLLLRVKDIQAQGGFGVVMDAATGEIYACASAPTFDITDLTKVEEGATNLSGISATFEPGSIFKPVTMLAALQAGTTQAGRSYDCPASITVGEYVISDSHDREDQMMDTTTIMAQSSNVGMSIIARDLTFEKLYDYIKQYQLSDKTGIDYPGEVGGYLSSWNNWSVVQGYNISFGQGLTVTPLSMTRFYGAIANGGVACTPHFLMDVPSDGEDKTYATSEIVTDKSALASLTGMLEAVVSEGTATDTQIDGYTVAGKTGTAEVADEAGGYKSGIYDISFVGFLPGASTNLVCFVGATDVPGERQTVPAFRDIMTFAIDRYNIIQK